MMTVKATFIEAIKFVAIRAVQVILTLRRGKKIISATCFNDNQAALTYKRRRSREFEERLG